MSDVPHQMILAGMNSTGRPVGTMLFLGPAGSGKPRIVEAASEVSFGKSNAIIKIDFAEFPHSHEIISCRDGDPDYYFSFVCLKRMPRPPSRHPFK